jgi:hypothetical protein
MKTAILTSFLITASAFATEYQATYTVPVEAALQPVSTFSLSQLTYENISGEVVLQYQLPVQLTGLPSRTVTFTGPANQTGPYVALSGPNGAANCNAAPGATSNGFSCSMRMGQLQIDPASVSQVLKASSATPQELNARMQVAAQFGSDPIGVVQYYPVAE